MRVGQNPAKMGLPAYQPKRLGMALLSYIPSRHGYFAQALEILKYQIASLHNATRDFDLLVFDNGSCAEVQEELLRMHIDNLIHFLVLSGHNVGKTGALNWILSAMPNELIGYSDGDVLFYPGWLDETVALMETFPRAGLVTAQPIFFDVLEGNGAAHAILQGNERFRLATENFPEDIIERYVREVNLDPEKVQAYKDAEYPIVIDQPTGRRALLLSSHMQFVITREVARQVVPLPVSMGLNRKDTVWLDRHIDGAGYLHLSTLDFHVRHMGNCLDQEMLDEIARLGLEKYLPGHSGRAGKLIPTAKDRRLVLLNGLARLPTFRNLFRRIYNLLFEFFAQ
jgi:glycosyltransferase involved in cell wall biosynthesis